MTALDTASTLQIIFLSVVLTLLLYFGLQAIWTRRDAVIPTTGAAPRETPAFLFDGDELVDASPAGRRLISDRPENLTEIDALINLVGGQFESLREDLERLKPGDAEKIAARDAPGLTMVLQCVDGLRRVSFESDPTNGGPDALESLRTSSQVRELRYLRELTDLAPHLIWAEDRNGQVIWANRIYLAYADKVRPDPEDAGLTWPGRRIFDTLSEHVAGQTGISRDRCSVRLFGEAAEHWFDVNSIHRVDHVLRFATEASEIVRAENTQREFRQTLAKTFAQLSTGLAIFDKRRQLTIFNPALLDMTGLPAGFLSSRPTIDLVLDRMRDMRKLPEPRDYAAWKERLVSFEQVAKDGSISETWDLPDGQTIRITGRPHPDGAVAFLFEDISAEISLTRHYRAELETGQAVLDTLPEAVAVFSSANTLVLTNTAYQSLWSIDDEDSLIAYDLRAAIRVWKAASLPSAFWSRLEDFAHGCSPREAWTDRINLSDGRHATCHVVPIRGGMTMVKFALLNAADSRFVPRKVHDQPSMQVAKS